MVGTAAPRCSRGRKCAGGEGLDLAQAARAAECELTTTKSRGDADRLHTTDPRRGRPVPRQPARARKHWPPGLQAEDGLYEQAQADEARRACRERRARRCALCSTRTATNSCSPRGRTCRTPSRRQRGTATRSRVAPEREGRRCPARVPRRTPLTRARADSVGSFTTLRRSCLTAEIKRRRCAASVSCVISRRRPRSSARRWSVTASVRRSRSPRWWS